MAGTTDAYRRSRFEERVVGKLLRESAFLVTNSPGTTREFVEYGIPRERLWRFCRLSTQTFSRRGRTRNVLCASTASVGSMSS
jgi:hypothetical protein